MANEWFFGGMGAFGIAAIIGVVLFILFLWWRANSAPAPGIPLGVYEVNGRYAGQTLHKRIKGVLVDCTGIFCAPEVMESFKDLLRRDLVGMISKPSLPSPPKPSENEADKTADISPGGNPEPEKTEIAPPSTAPLAPPSTQEPEAKMMQEMIENFEKNSLDKCCRVVITREFIFGEKHLIIHLGDPRRALSEYASHEEENHFSLSLGPVKKGVINGTIQTIPDEYDFKNERFKLGKVTVHVFRPDDPHDDEITKVAKQVISELQGQGLKKTLSVTVEKIVLAMEKSDLGRHYKIERGIAKVATYIPTAVNVEEQLKSKDQQLRDKDTAITNANQELTEKAVELDNYRTILKGLQIEGANLMSMLPKKLDILDFACMVGLPTILYPIVEALGGYPLIGVVIGVGAAGVLIYRRH